MGLGVLTCLHVPPPVHTLPPAAGAGSEPATAELRQSRLTPSPAAAGVCQPGLLRLFEDD